MNLLERIEELIALQEKLVNILLMSGSTKLNLPPRYAFEVLYSNLELLNLLAEAFRMLEFIEEDYGKESFISLGSEALSWMGIVLPAIEESCPIFLSGIGYIREPTEDINRLCKRIESLSERWSPSAVNQIVKELEDLSKLLGYYISLAIRSYESLA